jgi:nicotinate-nucleotide--dimethylbenzimidazole phosphoribosyltransferase
MKNLKRVIENIEPIDYDIMEAAQKRLDSLTKPQGSLGYLEEAAKQLAGIKRASVLKLSKKVLVVMAADHGVVEEGVSAYPQEVTSQMVYNFIAGGAGINVLARHVGAKIILVDMGVASDLEPSSQLVDLKIDYGTKNMAKGPTMTYEQAVLSLERGIRVVEDCAKDSGIDILGTGDMGIGNTTSSSAIIAAFTNLPIEAVTGRGTGIDDETFERKVSIIKSALQINKPNPNDPIDVLAKVGGFEIGGLAGCILAAANLKIPVVIDGFISSAAALIAYRLQPLIKDYIFAGHQSVEIGHTAVLRELDKKHLLNLNMRLGEGTGAALAMSLLEASVKIFTEMATFSEAQVSEAISEVIKD